jgi:hypothetical protein
VSGTTCCGEGRAAGSLKNGREVRGMKAEEIKKLDPDFCYRFRIRGRRRPVLGVPGGITHMNGFLYSGPALRIEVWHRRHGSWDRAWHDLLVPLPFIDAAEPVEGGFGRKTMVVETEGFSSLPEEAKEYCRGIAISRISPQVNFMVFQPGETGEPYLEDEGRTLVIPSPNLSAKVYAVLDDYRGAEEAALGHRWVLTLMLAEEW